MECPKWSKDEGKYVFEQKMFKLLLTEKQHRLLIKVMNNEYLLAQDSVRDFPDDETEKEDLKLITQILNKL